MEDKTKIGIIGLGLIGASILKSLQGKNYEFYCVSASSYDKAQAFSKIASDDINIIKDCKVIFVCSTIEQTPRVLDKLNEIVSSETIVLDVASSKKALLNKKYNFNFILSHPMAGSEKSGFDAGDKDLFIGAKWLIEKNNPLIEKIIADTGAIPLKINMENHDKLCAQISHLPTLLSFLLFDITDDDARQIASSGFRDTTRLAMTNSHLICDMLKNNFENIEFYFDLLTKELNYLKNLSDNEKIKVFNAISLERAKMYDKDGKNIFKI